MIKLLDGLEMSVSQRALQLLAVIIHELTIYQSSYFDRSLVFISINWASFVSISIFIYSLTQGSIN